MTRRLGTQCLAIGAPAESGGGGLVSTIDDYFAFSRMPLNRGRYGRERILSRATVELMTADQLTPALRAASEIFYSSGRFGWTGGFGTTAYTDPAHAMISIFFTQRMMVSPEPPKVFTDFWTLAYTACVDPLTTSATPLPA